jgi:type II secretory pathway pseudopilin PulG
MKRRAFTLLEVSVAASLSLLALLVLVSVLIPLSRSSARTVELLELSHLAHLASQRLLDDLQSCPPSALCLPQQGYFALHPLVRTTASARPVYDSSWIAYSWQQRSLRRQRVQPPALPVDHPHLPALDEMTAAFSNPGSKVLIAGALHDFVLERSGERAYRLRLELRSGQQRYTFDEVLWLRNGAL